MSDYALLAQLAERDRELASLRAELRDTNAKLQNMAIEAGEANGLLKREREEYASLRAELALADSRSVTWIRESVEQAQRIKDQEAESGILSNYLASAECELDRVAAALADSRREVQSLTSELIEVSKKLGQEHSEVSRLREALQAWLKWAKVGGDISSNVDWTEKALSPAPAEEESK